MNKIKIKIIQDHDPQCPRDWDNSGTMYCWHSRYNLGDKDGPEQLRTAVRSNKGYKESWEDYDSDNFRDLTDPAQLIETAKQLDIIMLPVYLYDHSGLTMNTIGFSCPWDSGQVGVIFITREKVRSEYSVKRISPKLLKRIKGYLRNEVEVYDQYLCGDVYGFIISEVDENDEEIEIEQLDSCWGFYGDNPKTNGMLEQWPEEYHNIEPEVEYH